MEFLRVVIAIILLSGPFLSVASDVDDANEKTIRELVSEAQRKELANNPYWLKLLHFRRKIGGLGAQESEVISPEFFLSPEGRRDPGAELTATIRAIFMRPDGPVDQHAQCRFVARVQWLSRQLLWEKTPPPEVGCPKYKAWAGEQGTRSVSLVFATAYLSNPASLYGHMLLRFNAPEKESPGGLLDVTTSYGAIVPEHESGVSYVFKGLFGGYEAGFSNDQFYRHNHNYAETDLRDLWVYDLDLTPDEVQQIQLHTWELLQVKFRYYFLSRNCAQRVAELLGLVTDERLLPPTPWDIPATVFDYLAGVKRDGRPLIRKVWRIPSRQNRFYEKYEVLTPEERNAVRRLSENGVEQVSKELAGLNEDSRASVFETLFDYYEFRAASDHDLKHFRDEKQRLLLGRARLSVPPRRWPVEDKVPPHLGQPPFLVQLQAIEHSVRGGGIQLRLRPAYYDFLSPLAGRLPESSLSMMDVRVRQDDRGVRLHSLDLVSIETLNQSRTGLDGDGGYAWSLRLGVEPLNLACTDCNVGYVSGGVGRALRLGAGISAFGMLSGAMQSDDGGEGYLPLTPSAGVILEADDGLRMLLKAGKRKYLDGERNMFSVASLEAAWSLRRDVDVRLSVARSRATEAGIAVGYYW